MTRKPDWQELLEAFFAEHRMKPFSYGRWDCCLFVCDAIRVMTGVDPAGHFRGAYRSRREATALVRPMGFQAMVAEVCKANSMQETMVPFARRGDVALVRHGARPVCSLGIVAMNGRDVVVVASQGLWRVPLATAMRAWRV